MKKLLHLDRHNYNPTINPRPNFHFMLLLSPHFTFQTVFVIVALLLILSLKNFLDSVPTRMVVVEMRNIFTNTTPHMYLLQWLAHIHTPSHFNSLRGGEPRK